MGVKQGPRARGSLKRIIKFTKNSMPGNKYMISRTIKTTKAVMGHTVAKKDTWTTART
jgi:hypothetical protein